MQAKHANKNVPFLQAWQPALQEMFGEEKASQITAGIREAYADLLTEAPAQKSRVLEAHLHKNIIPGLALYMVLQADGLDEEQAFDRTQKVYFSALEKNRTQQEAVGKLPFVYTLYRLLIVPMMRFGFPKPGFEKQWVERSSEQLAFNMTGCFYLDTLRKFGAEKLTPMFCNTDDFIYEGVSSYIEWKRTQTLAKGGTHCDFKFIRKRIV